MKRLMMITLALLAVATGAKGQWMQTLGPEGGIARTLIQTEGSTLAIMFPDHLYRLSPGVQSWTRIGTIAADRLDAVGSSVIASSTTDTSVDRPMREAAGR